MTTGLENLNYPTEAIRTAYERGVEDAALIADARWRRAANAGSFTVSSEAWGCAAAIRALKEKK